MVEEKNKNMKIAVCGNSYICTKKCPAHQYSQKQMKTEER